MRVKKVNRYYADCGRGFWTKKGCLEHEEKCKCWTNPKHKTCITCKHGEHVKDSNGMEDEPQNLETWQYWDCNNKEFDYHKHFTPAHHKAQYLCINCPLWASKEIRLL